MRAVADIDWRFFACMVCAHVAIGNEGQGICPGEAAAAAGVSRATFWRARQVRKPRRLTPLTFRAICAWMGHDPDRFRWDWQERQFRACGDRQQEAMAA